MPFQFRGDIAHADVAFDAWAASLDELFAAAAEATLAVMVESPSEVYQVAAVPVHLEEHDLEMLLFEWLNEIIFLKDARRLLLHPAEIRVGEAPQGCTIEALLKGEEIEPERHRLITDVKAVTLHRFSVRHTGERWEATVVLDV
ncbi:archease [Geomesophilobacter sediminis]|uniref:Archease n=1 Tax=Geomesophilobacter sediminis TaxID=2798584 RepID=A0A8J7M1U3_9BACT|nr:archease [Geomesophilobacter sediminis]MBJ6726958.1 archease [Geomesophilobacter sediminis]